MVIYGEVYVVTKIGMFNTMISFNNNIVAFVSRYYYKGILDDSR